MNVGDFKKFKKYIYMEYFQRIYPLKKIHDKYISRKTFFLIIIILVFLLYVWPFLYKKRRFKPDFCPSCLQSNLYFYKNDIDNYILTNLNKLDDNFILPFTGNGYIGFFLNDNEKRLHIKHKILSIPLDFFPKFEIADLESIQQEAFILSIKDGIILNYKCIKINTHQCITIKETIFTHRKINSLFVQQFVIENPSENTLFYNLISQKKSSISNPTTQNESTNVNNFSPTPATSVGDRFKLTHDIFTGYINGTTLNKELKYYSSPFLRLFAVPNVFLYAKYVILKPKTIEITPLSKVEVKAYTFFRYVIKILGKKDANATSEIFSRIDKLLKQDINLAFPNYDMNDIFETHVSSWNDLWKSGFAIARSKSSSALNGERINSTFYNYLCQQQLNPEVQESISNVLPFSRAPAGATLQNYHSQDNCYNSHSTLLSSTLWTSMRTKHEILNSLSLWDLTLDKNGCYNMIQNGAHGALQSLIFSVGSFKLTADHLEFSMNPKDLHRDMIFRRINYRNISYISVEVVIGEDNRASLSVVVEGGDENVQLYACDAGCQDPLSPLKATPTTFPVKQTTPHTSILYVSDDKDHLEYLKHTLHVQEIILAPAHEDHVIALHKHGHSFGGLPTFFWISIALLIVLFHLFLFKLIYSEYCGNSSGYCRDKYSV